MPAAHQTSFSATAVAASDSATGGAAASNGLPKNSGKINMMVQFPLELDLEQYTSDYMTNTAVPAKPAATDESNNDKSPPTGGGSRTKSGRRSSSMKPQQPPPQSLTIPTQHQRSTAKISPAIYSLFAVIVHDGTLDSGHYVCFVRQSGGGRHWFCYNDHMVTIVDWEAVKSCQAYMCFYVQKCYSVYDLKNWY
jgi:ubiquitin carboxyl-terminal hydrolase 22/27/51